MVYHEPNQEPLYTTRNTNNYEGLCIFIYGLKQRTKVFVCDKHSWHVGEE